MTGHYRSRSEDVNGDGSCPLTVQFHCAGIAFGDNREFMDARISAITFRMELRRALAAGIIETAGATFLMLIAVRQFQSSPLAKGVLAASANAGLLLTPLTVLVVARKNWPVSRAAAFFGAAGALAFLVAALFPAEWTFILFAALAMTSLLAAVPLMTQVYQDNYSEETRGRLFSRAVMVRVAVAAAFSWGVGWLLDADLGWYRWLLAVYAGAFAFSAWCLSRIPSRPLAAAERPHPFYALRFVVEDKLFRRMLMSWMLMGFANLMMVPLRVEMLANPRYRYEFTPGQIAFLTGVVPAAVRFILSPVWGWLFDRMNFIVLRVAINVGFAVGTLSFFTGGGYWGVFLGSVAYGVAGAGGDVAWSLWVTKFAPPSRVADYMSVHTFFNGVRGAVAPVVAFLWVSRFDMSTLGWISVGMIVAASGLILPEARAVQAKRKAAPLAEEVSE
ncbi:MAG: MFS transporter [Planctomycetota bacterium]